MATRSSRLFCVVLGAFLLSAWFLVVVDHARASDRVRVVNVSTADGEPIDPALWDTLRELFARVGVSLTANTPNRDPAAIEVRLAARHRGMDVIVTSAQHEPVHRRVDASDSDELFRETVAHVVLGMVEPLLDEQRAPPAPGPPTPPPEAPASVRVRTDLAAGAVMLARARFAPRVSLATGLVFPRAVAPSLALEAGLAPDQRRAHRSIEGRLYLLSLRVRPALEPLHAGRFALTLALPVGADLSWFALTDAPSGAATSESKVHADPVVGAEIGARVGLARGLSLTTTVGLDVAFRSRDFLIQDMHRTVVLAELDLLRPYLLIGLSWTSGHGSKESP